MAGRQVNGFYEKWGRILPLGDIKRAAPGFFPDGLLIRLEAKDETYTIKGGVLMKYQEGETNS